MEVVLAADAGELQRALDHAQRGVAVAVHDAVGERAVVGADAQGALQLLQLQHERGELLLDAAQFGGVGVVGVFLDGKLLGVGVVAGIDAHHLDPVRGFHRGVRLEVNVGHDGHEAAARTQLGDDVLQVCRVLHRGRGDADDLATDGDEFERLLDGLGGVHRVAGEHGLTDDRVVAAHDDAAARGVADDDFARGTAVE